jgi:hypothetical protein
MSRNQAAAGPLRANPLNPNYFSDANGVAIYLTGSHTWRNFQNVGPTDPPDEFDYETYIQWMVANNHNFIRLWCWEQTNTTVATEGGSPWFSPSPYERTGDSNANDGKPRFDLDRFNEHYFTRLHDHIALAARHGIYVSVMLFNGFSIEDKSIGGGNPWHHHPFNRANNINGIDGDPNNDGQGKETHTLGIPEITRLQEAYVSKVVQTVNEFDNVLFEISNESHSESTPWQWHMIRFIQEHERRLEKQHPVGMTAQWPGGQNADLFGGPADWISPGTLSDELPIPRSGKVVLSDTDHLWGIGGNYHWVWQTFTQGLNPIFMDPYDSQTKESGVFRAAPDLDPSSARWQRLRINLGYTLTLASCLDLNHMTHQPEKCSSGFCLIESAPPYDHYVIYVPRGPIIRVDVTAAGGELRATWIDPLTGAVSHGGPIKSGGNRWLIVPRRHSNGAVLFITPQGGTPDQPNCILH